MFGPRPVHSVHVQFKCSLYICSSTYKCSTFSSNVHMFIVHKYKCTCSYVQYNVHVQCTYVPRVYTRVRMRIHACVYCTVCACARFVPRACAHGGALYSVHMYSTRECQNGSSGSSKSSYISNDSTVCSSCLFCSA